MGSIALEKKRKNIDLPVETLHKLGIMAASQGKSLKAFIENILVVKAQSLEVEVYQNPSPSSDVYFENSDNLVELEKRVKADRDSTTKATVTLKTAEEIKNFMKNI